MDGRTDGTRETCEQRLSKVHKKDLREHQARVRQLLEEGWKPCPLKCAYGGGFKSEEECDHVTCQCGHEFCWHCGVNRKIPMAHDNRWHKPMCPYFTPRTSVLEPPKYEPACPACQANNGVPCSFPENDGYPHSYVQRGRKSKRPPKHHIHPLPLPHTAAESLDGSPHNQRQHQQQQQQHPHRGGQLFGPAIVMQLPDSQQPPPFAPPMYLPHQQQHQHQQPPHVALPRQESDSNAAMVVQAPSPPPPHPPHGLWVRHPDGSFGPSGDDNAQRQYSYTPQPMTRQNRPCPRNIGMPVPFAASRQLSHFPQPHTPGGGFDMAQPQYQHQQQDPAATAMVVDHHAPGSFVDRAVSENFDFSRGLGRGILHRGQPNTNTNTGPSGLSVPQQQHQQQQLQQQQLQQQPLGRALSAAMAQELPRRAEDVIMQLLGRGEGSGQKGPGGSEGAGGDGAS
ncbi:unnamed protein product [Vitrella brassicaformis CCMP3155]|uniref:RING-type domain-containing protein n=1 Tax=Vitrella brassicaformis (strain CCMP3155) TaxID=1169540 RepID=A0A0G4FG32_VITBC|nr:unnamed protein product [Vitrella brassicaformis CCMP3155]|eukprot:CEM12168.1 unnamed protein product [Vitrella brassicaformis CCMP3155]